MPIAIEKNKMCFCGNDTFFIQKHLKKFIIICSKCLCHREIISPGVSVDSYNVNLPFKNETNGNTIEKIGE